MCRRLVLGCQWVLFLESKFENGTKDQVPAGGPQSPDFNLIKNLWQKLEIHTLFISYNNLIMRETCANLLKATIICMYV